MYVCMYVYVYAYVTYVHIYIYRTGCVGILYVVVATLTRLVAGDTRQHVSSKFLVIKPSKMIFLILI